MQKIANEVLEVSVNENGSLLDSVKFKGEEYLWQGSEKSWKSKDIVIFPFVARLKDGWYPFDFRFDVKYTLEGSSLKIAYEVENTGDKEMFFGLGTHFGWIIDGEEGDGFCDVSGNYALIDTDAPIMQYEFDDDTHLVKGIKAAEFTNRIPLDKSTFRHDAFST